MMLGKSWLSIRFAGPSNLFVAPLASATIFALLLSNDDRFCESYSTSDRADRGAAPPWVLDLRLVPLFLDTKRGDELAKSVI
jgi:hypothetical protein